MRFDQLPLHPATLSALEAMGFEETTPVQAETIPILLEGRDLVAQAQTGTGKTAAYGIPLVEASRKGRRALVLAPTRELAQQVQRELQAIGRGSPANPPVDVVCLIGGAHFGDQVRAVKRHPDAIFVATPGRVVDHLGRGTLDLSGIGILVLDEADEMLSMGFQDDLDAIVAALPTPRQTMLFTATLAPAIERLAQQALSSPAVVRAGARAPMAASIQQTYALVRPGDRAEAVRRIMAVEQPTAALLFCRTRARVESLGTELQALSPEVLHGGMGQPARDAAMARLRSGRTKLLIATDVASRGLDVEGIELVLHDEPAADVDTYIHRTGRTGRAGRSGRSILFLAPNHMRRLGHLQHMAGRLERYEVPGDAAIARAHAARLVATLKDGEPGPEANAALAEAERGGMAVRDVALRALQALVAKTAPATPLAAMASAEPEAPTTIAVSLKVGAVDGLRPGDVVGMLANEGGLAAGHVGRIDILPHITMVEVPEADATRLVGALHRAQFRGRRVLPRLAEDWQFKANRGMR
jgi:ATP-dependent RNA helicase DeaD